MEINADEGNVELLITRLITKIKNNHSRPCLQNIHHHLNRGNYKIEMAELEDIIDGMIQSDKIRDIGKNGAESYRITTLNDKPLEDVSDNDNPLEDDPDKEDVSSLESYINEKFYDIITNRIKSEIKLQLSPVSTRISDNNDDAMITILKDQVDFLKKELESKNTIIQMLLKEKKTSQLLDVQSSTTKNKEVEEILITLPQETNDDFIKTKTKRNITILGDSILKDMDQYKLRKDLKSDKVYIKTFPGATNDCMSDYIKPALKYKPDVTILHCGTNDLKKEKSSSDIADEVVNLCNVMKDVSKRVIISGLINRSDDLDGKVREVNNILKIKCRENNLNFCDNSNLYKIHLNKSGIHLNPKGTYILANNFLDCLDRIN